MRRSVCALALAAVLALLSCHRNSTDALVGKWLSVARAKNGTATMTEFRSNGTFTSAFEATLECSYRLDGGLMILSVSNPQTGRTSEDTAQVRIDGDTLYLKSPLHGGEEPMQRLGPPEPGAPPILGRWGSGVNGPHPVFAEFTRDGKMKFMQTLRSASGTYSVSGNTLTLNFEDAPRQTGKFRFESGTLVLTPEKGEEQRLAKME
jgi:hypothetical protein